MSSVAAFVSQQHWLGTCYVIIIMVTTTHPKTRQSKQVVRSGPLLIGAILLLAVPLSILSILSSTLETKNQLGRGDRLVEHHHWRGHGISEEGNQDHLLAVKGLRQEAYQGQSYLEPSSTIASNVVVAETALAKCELVRLEQHAPNHLVLEVQDLVQIAVIDTQHKLWVLEDRGEYQDQDSIRLVPPASSDNRVLYQPLSGYVMHNEAPWYAAQRIVTQILEILPGTTIYKSRDAVLDSFGLKDGHWPIKDQQDWVFLGRHRVTNDQGAGFVYSYLLQSVDSASPKETNARHETAVSLSLDETKQVLANGQFSDARGITSITLALLQYAKDRGFNM